jgi:integral membrane protein
MLSSSLGRFRIVAFLEGLSYILLLFIAMPLKHFAGIPEFVKHIGMAHGVLFVMYALLLIILKFQLDWSFKKCAILFLASLLPFGTFYADKKYLRN